ncbi:MAG TPA: coenzyme F420-0:L-glutamate ligase [Solirubrobacteraceae bacterium]|nr:coenzyme F420-0:L-glutamate ligase [Solirubrobacteraceae bacterium]
MLSAIPVEGIGELRAGDDLAELIWAGLERAELTLGAQDVIVIAHKAVSKIEGRVRRLSEVSAGERAQQLAAGLEKDPRLVQVILEESRAVIRAAHGVLITETRHGFICANAGVDASNVAGEDTVLMLPVDPDASARRIRSGLRERTGAAPGIVITDSFGRAWRTGQCDVAVGCAGVVPLEDWRGGHDAYGRELRATVIAVADQLAATADLARRKDGQQPVVLIRGAGRHVRAQDGPGVAPLIRDAERDLFR